MSRSPMTRRAVLRGAGVSITLPFLESWLPAAAPPQSAPPLRVVFLYAPNGKHMPDWTPRNMGALADLPLTLRPLQEMLFETPTPTERGRGITHGPWLPS
jgi:hypothetical protein